MRAGLEKLTAKSPAVMRQRARKRAVALLEILVVELLKSAHGRPDNLKEHEMPRINFDDLPLTSDQARAARNYFGLSQAKAAEASSLPLHKIKRFEAGNYVPDTEFLEELREYYEGRGFAFEDTPEPGAKAKGTGQVFPAGVVGNSQEYQDSPHGRRAQKSTVQHMRIAITDDGEIGRALDLIEGNEQKADELLRQPAEGGLFGGLSDRSQARHAEVLKLMAENGAQFARLFGRDVGGAPKAEVLRGEADPKSHADVLHWSQADAHLAVAGNRDAKVRHQTRAPAKTLSAALFG